LSVCRFTHIIDAPEPQTVFGAVQVSPQTPLLQTWPAGQTVLQFPQCDGLLSTLMHIVPHSMLGAMQNGTHAPPVQTSPAGHTVPQPPQLVASVWVFTHIIAAPEPQSV
jgi:hypothetical protein